MIPPPCPFIQALAGGGYQGWVLFTLSKSSHAGFLYLAIILGVFSRWIVVWAMTNHMRTERVVEALKMAVVQRRPKPLATTHV